MLRRTPLFDRHVSAGARMVPFAGFEMPVQYVGVTAEHKQVRAGVGLFDVSHMGEIRVRGPKAIEAVDWLVTNQISTLAVGQARYTLLPNPQGGVVDDLVVYRVAADDLLICCNAANREKDWAWITGHLRADHADGVTLTDEGDAWAQIAVQGPQAVAVVQRLTAVDLAPIGRYWFAPGAIAGVEGCLLARTGYTGEDGFEIFVPVHDDPSQAARVWDALLAAGAPEGAMPIGLGARDTLRLEARFPLYGHELTDETSPVMARLMWVTRLDKPGGFLGADAIAARRATDSLVLVGALIDDRKIVREGMRVLVDGEPVGHVTSGTLSPMREQGVALAYVPKAYGEPGARLQFDVRGRVATGTVVKGAFHTLP